MQLGINGAGFFENLDDYSKERIKELNNMHIRVPGGAISRFHQPFSVRNGWGITAEAVNYFFGNYTVGVGEDDPDGGRDKWLQKAAEQPNYSYLDSLISLSNEMPGLKVIYVINVFTSSAEEQLNTLSYLVTNGVRVEVVEFGNEVYGKYEFNTADYISFCSPIIATIKQQYPEMKVSLISGNFKGRRDHDQWNSQLADYVNNPENKIDYVTLHFYIGDDLAPNAYASLPAPKVVDYTAVDSQLQAACEFYVDEVIMSNRFQEEVDAAAALYNTKFIVTEWNNNPATAWCNTFVNAAWIFTEFVRLEGVDILCLHNGVSPDIYGAICRKKQQDDTTLEMVPRVSYYALKLAAEYLELMKTARSTIAADVTICSPGVTVIPIGFSEEAEGMLQIIPSGGIIKSISTNLVEADYPYSSSGATGFQAKNQPKNMEIVEIGRTTDVFEKQDSDTVLIGLGTNCFGYIKIEVEEANDSPIAYAGDDATYTIRKNETTADVILDGSGSYDPDGSITKMEWVVTKEGDPSFTTILTDMAPVVLKLYEGVYYATLVVTDNKGTMSSDSAKITVKKRKKGFFTNLFTLNAKKNNTGLNA